MRPCGELRLRLTGAVADFERHGVTWRALAQGLGAEPALVKETVKNMVSAGELVVVGQCREPGVLRPMNLYALPTFGALPLCRVMRVWPLALAA
ncbi:MAG: hypothetical protein HEQ39_09595 [Rhizobacter sp.]